MSVKERKLTWVAFLNTTLLVNFYSSRQNVGVGHLCKLLLCAGAPIFEVHHRVQL